MASMSDFTVYGLALYVQDAQVSPVSSTTRLDGSRFIVVDAKPATRSDLGERVAVGFVSGAPMLDRYQVSKAGTVLSIVKSEPITGGLMERYHRAAAPHAAGIYFASDWRFTLEGVTSEWPTATGSWVTQTLDDLEEHQTAPITLLLDPFSLMIPDFPALDNGQVHTILQGLGAFAESRGIRVAVIHHADRKLSTLPGWLWAAEADGWTVIWQPPPAE